MSEAGGSSSLGLLGSHRRKRRAATLDAATDGGTIDKEDAPPKIGPTLQFINQASGQEALALGPLKEVLCVRAFVCVCVCV